MARAAHGSDSPSFLRKYSLLREKQLTHQAQIQVCLCVRASVCVWVNGLV